MEKEIFGFRIFLPAHTESYRVGGIYNFEYSYSDKYEYPTITRITQCENIFHIYSDDILLTKIIAPQTYEVCYHAPHHAKDDVQEF